MTWQIKLPIRDPDEILSLKAIDELTDLLDGEDALIAHEMLFGLYRIGLRARKSVSVGLIDQLFREMEPGERRQFLDLCRLRAGLPSIKSIEDAAAFEQVQRVGAAIRAETTPWQGRHFEGCTTVPTDPMTSLQVPVDVRRWWCEEHRHLATDGDMQPRPPLRMSDSGFGFVDDEVEAAEHMRELAKAESRRREREERQAERAVEAAERDAFEAALAATWRGDNLIVPG